MAPRDLLAEALKLPSKQRARIVKELVRSLDEERGGPTDTEGSWAKELERRARRARRGESVGRDWDAAIRKIASKHRRK
jgi:putative addiction module component (TIGR02574 family)